MSSDTQTGKIETLHGLSEAVKREVSNQTGEIETLQRLNQAVKREVSNQTGEIETLQELSREVKYEVKTLIAGAAMGIFVGIVGIIITIVLSETFLNLLIEIHEWLQSL